MLIKIEQTRINIITTRVKDCRWKKEETKKYELAIVGGAKGSKSRHVIKGDVIEDEVDVGKMYAFASSAKGT